MSDLLNSCQYLEYSCGGLFHAPVEPSQSDDEGHDHDDLIPPGENDSDDESSTDSDHPHPVAPRNLPSPPPPSGEPARSYSHIV